MLKGDIELKFLFAFNKCMVLIFGSFCLCAMGRSTHNLRLGFHIHTINAITSNFVAKFTTLLGCEEQVKPDSHSWVSLSQKDDLL